MVGSEKIKGDKIPEIAVAVARLYDLYCYIQHGCSHSVSSQLAVRRYGGMVVH
jgi:hypothetical protein